MRLLFVILGLIMSNLVSAQSFEFSEKWTWEYSNDWIQEGEVGRSGHFSAYFNPKTKEWLFDKEAYGEHMSLIDFVIGQPSGAYLIGYTGTDGKKKQVNQEVYEYKVSLLEGNMLIDIFKEDYAPLQSYRKYPFGKDMIEGQGFQFKQPSDDIKVRYVTDRDINFATIVYFNFLTTGPQLPFLFPSDVPAGFSLLEETSTYKDGKSIHFKVKEVQKVKKSVNLKKYN